MRTEQAAETRHRAPQRAQFAREPIVDVALQHRDFHVVHVRFECIQRRVVRRQHAIEQRDGEGVRIQVADVRRRVVLRDDRIEETDRIAVRGEYDVRPHHEQPRRTVHARVVVHPARRDGTHGVPALAHDQRIGVQVEQRRDEIRFEPDLMHERFGGLAAVGHDVDPGEFFVAQTAQVERARILDRAVLAVRVEQQGAHGRPTVRRGRGFALHAAVLTAARGRRIHACATRVERR